MVNWRAALRIHNAQPPDRTLRVSEGPDRQSCFVSAKGRVDEVVDEATSPEVAVVG